MLSLAQDLIYISTGGMNWSPKRIDLASTCTRLLVPRNLFNYRYEKLTIPKLQVTKVNEQSAWHWKVPHACIVVPPNKDTLGTV